MMMNLDSLADADEDNICTNKTGRSDLLANSFLLGKRNYRTAQLTKKIKSIQSTNK